MVSISNTNILKIFESGFYVKNGVLYKQGIKKPIHVNNNGYYRYSFYDGSKVNSVLVHRLVAYEKFGDKIFEKGVVVRHLDGNPLNNLPDNIEIGTQHDNMMDRSKDCRIKTAVIASYVNRSFTDEEVCNICNDRKKGFTYDKLIKKYNTSKSTLSYLFNNALYAKRYLNS
jgi:hypothetical protein